MRNDQPDNSSCVESGIIGGCTLIVPRSYVEDEGRPLDDALQGESSNRPQRLEHRSSTPSFGMGRVLQEGPSPQAVPSVGPLGCPPDLVASLQTVAQYRVEMVDDVPPRGNDPLYRNWSVVWRIGLLLNRDTKTLGMVQVFERRTGWARRVAPTINAIGRSAEGRLARYPERSRDRPRHSPLAEYSSTLGAS